MAVVKNTPLNMLGITESRASAAMVLADLRNGAMLDAAFERYVAPLDARESSLGLLFGEQKRGEWVDCIVSGGRRGGGKKSCYFTIIEK